MDNPNLLITAITVISLALIGGVTILGLFFMACWADGDFNRAGTKEEGEE